MYVCRHIPLKVYTTCVYTDINANFALKIIGGWSINAPREEPNARVSSTQLRRAGVVFGAYGERRFTPSRVVVSMVDVVAIVDVVVVVVTMGV